MKIIGKHEDILGHADMSMYPPYLPQVVRFDKLQF